MKMENTATRNAKRETRNFELETKLCLKNIIFVMHN